MKKEDQKRKLLEAFLHGLKLGQVLGARVDYFNDHQINLMIPATGEGEDQEDHFGYISFDFLEKSGDIFVHFDTLNERVQYAAQGCENEAWTQAGMTLDSEHWQKQAAEEERENTSTH